MILNYMYLSKLFNMAKLETRKQRLDQQKELSRKRNKLKSNPTLRDGENLKHRERYLCQKKRLRNKEETNNQL